MKTVKVWDVIRAFCNARDRQKEIEQELEDATDERRRAEDELFKVLKTLKKDVTYDGKVFRLNGDVVIVSEIVTAYDEIVEIPG